MYSRIYETKQGDRVTKRWIEARSEDNDQRRATEKELGPLTGRQWVRVRKRLRKVGRTPVQHVLTCETGYYD